MKFLMKIKLPKHIIENKEAIDRIWIAYPTKCILCGGPTAGQCKNKTPGLESFPP